MNEVTIAGPVRHVTPKSENSTAFDLVLALSDKFLFILDLNGQMKLKQPLSTLLKFQIPPIGKNNAFQVILKLQNDKERVLSFVAPSPQEVDKWTSEFSQRITQKVTHQGTPEDGTYLSYLSLLLFSVPSPRSYLFSCPCV